MDIDKRIGEFKYYWKIFQYGTDTSGLSFEEALEQLLEDVAKEQHKLTLETSGTDKQGVLVTDQK